MINITIENECDDLNLMKPEKMLTQKWDHGTVFQLFDRSCGENTYFIHCGMNEKQIIMIWFDSEDGEYKLSIQNLSELREYCSDVLVMVVNKDINIHVGNRR